MYLKYTMYIHTENFFSNEYNYSSFKLLKSIYKTLTNNKNDDNYKFFCVICMTINKPYDMLRDIKSDCRKIIKSLQHTVHNFKIELYNGTVIQCIKEIIIQIPYIALQLTDITDNIDYFKFYNLNFTSNSFNIIIDFIYDKTSIISKLNMNNAFELLIISEQLLLPSTIIQKILHYLDYSDMNVSSHLSCIDNIDINTLTEISMILETLKNIYVHKNISLFRRICSVYNNIFNTVYNTIIDNSHIFKDTIFCFNNHTQFFSNKLHMKAIMISNQYHKFNDTRIKPNKILKFLMNKESDTITHRYDWSIICENKEQKLNLINMLTNNKIKKINKIYNKFSWLDPEVYYFKNDNYIIDIHSSYIDNITVIKNYYPSLYYIVYKKIYTTWSYIDNHVIKVSTDCILPNTDIIISTNNSITQNIITVCGRKMRGSHESLLYLKESINENYYGDIWSVKYYSYNFQI